MKGRDLKIEAKSGLWGESIVCSFLLYVSLAVNVSAYIPVCNSCLCLCLCLHLSLRLHSPSLSLSSAPSFTRSFCLYVFSISASLSVSFSVCLFQYVLCLSLRHSVHRCISLFLSASLPDCLCLLSVCFCLSLCLCWVFSGVSMYRISPPMSPTV